MFVAANNTVWVADASQSNGRVQCFSIDDGSVVRIAGGRLQGAYSAVMSEHGDLFVVEYSANRIQVFA